MSGNVHTKRKLAIYCSASRAVGFGHLRRCLALAAAAQKRGADAIFLVSSAEPEPIQLVRSLGHYAEVADDKPASSIAALPPSIRNGIRWVILDSYDVDSVEMSAIAQIAPLAVIEDLFERDLGSASLVISPLPNPNEHLLSDGDVAVLDGPQYALVGEPFLMRRTAERFTRSVSDAVRKVAVAMGATDSGGYLEGVVSTLNGWDEIELRVAGLVNERALRGQPGVMGLITTEEMAELMEWADLFVASASSLTWELATLGVPSAFVVTVPNQNPIGRYLASEIDVPVAWTGEELSRILSPELWTVELRRNVSDSLFRLCDGRGADRVAEALLA